MQHNYYIGFRLPDALAKDIERIQQQLFDPLLMKEPLEPHITMLPPPAVQRLEPEELVHQIRVTAEPYWPLRLTLSQIDTFEEAALAVKVNSETIYLLQRELVALLPPEAKVVYYPNASFTPHVTLAQALRGKKLPKNITHDFKEQLAAILPATFEAHQLTIFKWFAPRHYTAHEI